MTDWIDPNALAQISRQTGIPYARLATAKYGYSFLTKKTMLYVFAGILAVSVGTTAAIVIMDKKNKKKKL